MFYPRPEESFHLSLGRASDSAIADAKLKGTVLKLSPKTGVTFANERELALYMQQDQPLTDSEMNVYGGCCDIGGPVKAGFNVLEFTVAGEPFYLQAEYNQMTDAEAGDAQLADALESLLGHGVKVIPLGRVPFTGGKTNMH